MSFEGGEIQDLLQQVPQQAFAGALPETQAAWLNFVCEVDDEP